MPTIAAIVLAALFGAADQYLGSWPGHGWAVDASLLAAPWLVLPFLVGFSQRSARRAIVLACGCTFLGLLAYLAMTLSPIEQAKVSLAGLTGLLTGQVRWFGLGAVTAPLLGWLGFRWRASRGLWFVVVPAAALVLEPFARSVVSEPVRCVALRWLEICAGVAFWLAGLLRRSRVDAVN